MAIISSIKNTISISTEGNISSKKNIISEGNISGLVGRFTNSLATNGSSKRLTVYANGKSTETNSVKFLTSYVDKKCTGSIGIRDSKNGKSFRFDILPDSIELAKD